MGPVRGVVSVDTHNSQISGHHDYLAEMNKKAPIATGPPLFFSAVQIVVCVHVCILI